MKINQYKILKNNVLRKLEGLDMFRLWTDSEEGAVNTNNRLLKYDKEGGRLFFQTISTGKTFIVDVDEFLASEYNLNALGYCLVSNLYSLDLRIILTVGEDYAIYLLDNNGHYAIWTSIEQLINNDVKILLIKKDGDPSKNQICTDFLGLLGCIKKVIRIRRKSEEELG